MTTGRIAVLFSAACCGPAFAASGPAPAFTGLPGARAFAMSPQGALYVALPDRVVQLLGPRVSQTFAAESFRSMAFDRTGNLYGAGERGIVRITPSGEISTAGGGCAPGAPFSVAVDAAGTVYHSVPESFAVCRGGRRLDLPIARPGVLSWSSFHGALLIAGRDGAIWRMRDGKAEKWIEAGRSLAGMAVAEDGSAYTIPASEARIAVYDSGGKHVRDLPLPSPASAIAFGGLEHDRLFATIPGDGSVHRLAPGGRGEPALWEDNRAFRIVSPADGAILNRHDGSETAAGLRVSVTGRCRPGDTVTVNGSPAAVSGGGFRAEVTLKASRTRIEARNARGGADAVEALYDRNSFRRYRMSVDDNIWWLKDIALRSPAYASIFDNPYLSFWREMHRKYGARIHFNIYFETAGFDLTALPDRYRDEWRKNADWLRLTFHARANDPDRPYLHTTAERIAKDYATVNREIERFAGREVMSPATTIHWGETPETGVRALRQAGVTAMAGYFEVRQDIPSVSYHVTTPQLRHLQARDYWKDPATGTLFVRHDMVINSVKLDEVVPRLEKLARDPHQSELLELMIHEQYFYPAYSAYRPDYREAVERAIRWATENKYRPVFLEEGFLGNPGR